MNDENAANRNGQRFGSFFFACLFGSAGLITLPNAVVSKNVDSLIISGAFILAATVALINGLFSPQQSLFKNNATRKQRLVGTTLLASLFVAFMVGFPLLSLGTALKKDWIVVIGIVVFFASFLVSASLLGYFMLAVIRDLIRANAPSSEESEYEGRNRRRQ